LGFGRVLWYIRSMKVLLLVVTAGLCAYAQKITVEFDTAADFTKYHTFLIRNGALNSRNPALNSELVKKNIENSITHYLTVKGLEIGNGTADLNVNYHFGSAARSELEAYPAGWRGWGTAIVRVPYTEGTLVVDLRDPSTRSLVWRSIAREDKTDPMKIEGKLDTMVKKSVDKYPPKPKK
jgi:hypothetical protein